MVIIIYMFINEKIRTQPIGYYYTSCWVNIQMILSTFPVTERIKD